MQPAFGAASTPAFGAASTPAFGSAATPAFGGGNAFGVSRKSSPTRIQVAIAGKETMLQHGLIWCRPSRQPGLGALEPHPPPACLVLPHRCIACHATESRHHPQSHHRCDNEERHDHMGPPSHAARFRCDQCVWRVLIASIWRTEYTCIWGFLTIRQQHACFRGGGQHTCFRGGQHPRVWCHQLAPVRCRQLPGRRIRLSALLRVPRRWVMAVSGNNCCFRG